MAPPSTWRWRHPFTSVLDGDAPLDAGHPVMKPFESRDACETLRAELARRESNPRLRAAPRVDGEFPRDFYTRSRCALLASPGPTS